MGKHVVTAVCDCNEEELRFNYESDEEWSFCEVSLWQSGKYGTGFWSRIKGAWSALLYGEHETWWVGMKPSSVRKLGEDLVKMSEVIHADAVAKGISKSCL